MFKKVLFSCVALTLVVSSFAAVGITAAATISDGDLVKSATDTATYLIQDSEKRVFPHANVYHSWGYPDDWGTVKTVSSSDLAAYTDGSAVPFRDGSMFRGTATSLEGKEKEAVFYVSDGDLRDIKSAVIYQALFNDEEWKYVTWVPDDLLEKFSYGLGDQIDSSATYPNGAILQVGSTKYLVAGGEVREFSEGAFEANGYDDSADVVPVYTVDSVSGYTAGDAVAGEETDLVTPGEGAPIVIDGGTGVTVSLASDTPDSATIVENAARVGFTKVNLTASSDGDVKVRLKVERTGLSADSNISNVVFYDGMTQIGNEKSLNAAHQCTSDYITVEAGETRSITISANTSGTMNAGEVVGLELVEVVTDATVNGSLPITGNEMTMNGTLAIGTLTVARGVDDPNGAATKKVGTKSYTFISAKVTVNSVEAFDIELIEFTNATGSAGDDDVENLELLVDGIAYMDGEMVNGVVTFDISDNPVTILKGKNAEFGLRGDIADGSGRTINFVIYDQVDIQGRGQKYDFYRLPTFPDTAVPYWHPNSLITIGSGALSFSTGADQAANIPEGEEGLTLGTWSIKATGEDVICTTSRFDIDVQGVSGNVASASDITNITLYDENDTAVTSATDGTDDASTETGDGYVSYTDTITFPVGSGVYTLRGDLNTVWSVDDGIQIGLAADSSGYWTCKGELTNQPVSETPAVETDAMIRTVKPGALAVTNSATVPVTNENYVKGNEVEVARVTYSAANSGEDVKITKLRFIVDSVTSRPDELSDVRIELKSGSLRLGTADGTLVSAGTQIEDDGTTGNEWDSTTADASDTADFFFTGTRALILPAGDSFTISLFATISNNTVANDEFLAASATSTSGVTAVGLTSGESITETYTGNGQKFVVSAGGTLTVSISANSPALGLIVPGDMKTITVFSLDALYEDITLDKVDVEHLTEGTNASTSVNDIALIYLTDAEGNIIGNSQGYSPTENATSTNILNLAASANKLVIPKDGSKELYVKADINPIRVTSTIATSGHQVGYRVTGGTSDASSYIVGKSNASSSITADIGTGISVPTGNYLYLRKGIPIVTHYGANSSGSWSGAGTQLVSTSGETKSGYHFKVAADSAGGNIALYSVVFDIGSTTASASTFYWYDITQNAGSKLDSSQAQWNDDELAGLGEYQFVIDGTDTNDEIAREISPGAPHTFRIEFTAKNDDASSADSYVTVTMLGDAQHTEAYGSASGGGFAATTASGTMDEIMVGASANFVWSDGSGDNSHASGTSQWYNGYKVPGLDATNTSYQVIFAD